MTLRKITKKEELETILTGDMPHRACYYDDYFPTCFAMIDTAYNICLLKGWEHSEGVRRELEHARDSDREYCVFELVILTE